MQKRSLIWAAILLLPAAHAGSNEQANELAAAQMNYQNLLKAQANDRSNLTSLQARLKSAEKKLETAQLEVNKLRAEFMLREEAQLTYDAKLKDAGTRLNKAWEAVNGVAKPKTTESTAKPQTINDVVKSKTEAVKTQATQAVKTATESAKTQATQAVKNATESAKTQAVKAATEAVKTKTNSTTK